MKTKKYILIGICFCILVSLAFAIDRGKKAEYYIKFDGVIQSVDSDSLTVQGDPQNDAGQRGQYIIKSNDSISVRNSRGGKIDFASLAVGDHVEILYMDYIVKSKIEQYALDDGAEVPDVQQIDITE
ncbi:MAG: hypothetical protein HFI57_14450 [Lachnospiraceae bacterium]|nr:hypothetical protein [Lachnospiraceae bacterium]